MNIEQDLIKQSQSPNNQEDSKHISQSSAIKDEAFWTKLEQEAEDSFKQKKWADAAVLLTQILEHKSEANAQYNLADSLPSIEMAPFLFKYAKCLFMLSQAELFSEAASKASADIAEAIESSMETSSAVLSSKAGPSSEKKLIEIELPTYSDEDDDDWVEEAECDENQPAITPVGDMPNESEEVDDLKIAWESLDSARLVYQKEIRSGKVDQYRNEFAEVLDLLGDISVENEAFPQAIEDFKECVKILQSDLIEDHSRHIAEVYYKISMAWEYSNDCSKAKEYVEMAYDLLKNHYSQLPVEAISEKTELEALFPDIEAKIEDLKMGIAVASKNNFETLHDAQCLPSASSVWHKSEDNLPVNDISGMIRKKSQPSTASIVVDQESLAGNSVTKDTVDPANKRPLDEAEPLNKHSKHDKDVHPSDFTE